jgi:branched-chain amino acid transport system substrate-binding protein
MKASGRRARQWSFPLSGLIAASALVPLAACGSSNNSTSSGSNTAAAASCDSPGVSATEIKLGDLYPLSGSTVSQRNGWGQGVRARFDALNDSGGVNNRSVQVVDEDDQGTASADLDRMKDLVESKGVFGVLTAPIVEASGDYTSAQNVPVVGHGSTPTWGGQYKNYFGTFGSFATGIGSTAYADFIKKQGGSVVAIIAHNNPNSLPAAKIFQSTASTAGLKVGYTRLDLPFVPGDFTADAQQMKANNVDSLYSPVANAVSLALYKAAVQAGVQWKAFIFPNFYDPAALKQTADSFTTGGAYTISPTAPFELNLPETKKFQAAMAKYESGAPVNAFSMEGWDAAELFIEGLKAAGPCPTRQGFIDALHNKKDWTGNGTLPLVDFSKPQACSWIVKITPQGYVPTDKAATCGQLVKANT